MVTKMKVSLNYGTHLAPLMKAVRKTTGDILELGMGVFSTPFLHYTSILENRKVVSVENFQNWAKFFRDWYDHPTHKILIVDKYANAPIDKEWDVVLIDQTPDSSRTEEIRRLANLAKYIVIHDANRNNHVVTHYNEIYPLFKYRTDWTGDANSAVVLSNLVDLGDFWK